MTCREATYLHEQKKEGKLTFGQRLSLGFHLLICHLCRLFVKQVTQLEQQAKNIADTQQINTPLDTQAKEKMREALSREMNR